MVKLYKVIKYFRTKNPSKDFCFKIVVFTI